MFTILNSFHIYLYKYKQNQILQLNRMQKGVKYRQLSEHLNKKVNDLLEEFSHNTEWTDINNWLRKLENALREYPSPFISEKVLLSKRLNQCINPVLPQKVHEQVLKIHEILFNNMRESVDGDINQYKKLFASDLGIYSLTLLPYFAHSTVTLHRLTILQIFHDFYLDLGYQLIPMLMGIIKALLPAYSQTNDKMLKSKIEEFINQLIEKSGRRYVISSIWSSILKFSDCRLSGVIFLSKLISKMAYKKGEQEFSQSHGFSRQEQQLQQQLQLENMGVVIHKKDDQQVKEGKENRRAHSTSSNEERKLPFSIENHFYSQMELPEYIIRKQEDIIKEMQRSKKLKRSKTLQASQRLVGMRNTKEEKDKIKQNLLQSFKSEAQHEREQNKQHSDKTQSPKKYEQQAKEQAQPEQKIEKQVQKQQQKAIDQQKDKQNPDNQNVEKDITENQQQVIEKKEDLLIKQEQEIIEQNSMQIQLQRNSRGHIKLNKVPNMELPGIQDIKLLGEQNNDQNNYPSHSTLVINALIACLQDPSQFIKRAALDFMFTHLRLKSDVLQSDDKIILTQALIRLFRKQQMSIVKRVDRWLLGRQNQHGQFEISQKNEFVLPLIINALSKILSKQPKNQELCITPIKIVQNFYTQHENLIDLTISNIFLELVRYIFNYGSGFEYSDEIIKAGHRFFSNIPSHYPILFVSLGKKIFQAIEINDDHLAYQCIRYIDYCYIKLMKHDHGVQQLQYITVTLENLTQALKRLTKNRKQDQSLYKIYLRDLTLLIYNLLSRRQSVQRHMQKAKDEADKKFLQQTGLNQLPAERINYQQQLISQQQKQKEKYSIILENIQFFYLQLGRVIRVTPNIQVYEDIYRLSSLSIIKILSHLPRSITIKGLPIWFSTIQYGIRVTSPTISLAAIDSLIKCLLFTDKHPIYEQLKIRIMEDKSKKIGNDYQTLALEKLWALLDFPHMHTKILDLIVAFSKFFPYQFTETVHKSFETHNGPEKQASIQRFSHFWRLTGFKYKDLLVSNREFAELNKVGLFKMLDFLEDSNPLVRHAAKNWMVESLPLFHRVIQPLFHELMKAAGDWYITPKGLIIIKEIYDTKIIFNTFRRIRALLSSGTYSFLKYVYQYEISDGLDQLKQRVTSIKQPILSTQASNSNKREKQKLQEKLNDGRNSDIGSVKQIKVQRKKLTYIDMLIILAVRYIQGYTLESMGIDFYTGNIGVCTSAIQLLDSLINYIDNPTICSQFIEFILPTLSKVLSQSVINQQYITQIQLINLFKTIFFNSSFRKKASSQEIRVFFNKIFTKTVFLQSSLNGLKTPFSYVRAQFVNFITDCIVLIANFLDPDHCTKSIKQILITYYKIIKEIRISLIEEVLDEEVKRHEKLQTGESTGKKGVLSEILKLEIKAKKQEKLAKISHNIQQVAKTNSILSILHGVSAILNYFFDLDKMTVDEMKFSFEKQFSIVDSFKSILTLGLSTSKRKGRLVERTQFLHNLQTSQSILKDLSPVYETILRAWPLSEQFVRIATDQFSSIGSRTFNFEKFSKYNKVLKDLIKFVGKQKESIWGKIFSIMQPMFYRFPRDIMQIYLHLWVRQCTNAGQSKGLANFNQVLTIKPNVSNTELLMKNIQTIVVSNFPVNIIVHAFLESQFIEQIRNYYSEIKNEKKQSLSFKICQLQAKLIYFLYAYFTYSFIEQNILTKQSLTDIWSNIIKVLEPFSQSKSPATSLWILDLINMCSIKYSPKQILKNQKFKTDLHSLINKCLKYVASIASKKQIVYYDDPTKTMFKEGQELSAEKFRIILPIPPTIYELYKAGPINRKDTDNCLFQPIKAGDFLQLQKINRLWCFRVLRKIGFQILQNTYLTQKLHFAVSRACEWMQIILPTIENKAVQNMIYAESASEILYHLLDSSRLIFIKPLKSSIFKIFDKDDFFICNKNTLKYWAQIIDWIVSLDNDNETFSSYLDKASLSNSFFTSATTENKNRIKGFQRICFILYSGAQDKYAHKIKGLLKKISQLIKQVQSCHPGLLILVLFSIRILIYRLSQISLNQLFIDIWPMILAFLMQIFSKKLVKVEIANQISRNPNLLLAALKLVQMISISNLGQFAHHQWIFLYDYFGIKLSLMQTTPQLSEIFSERPQLTQLATFTRTQVNSPFLYKPYMNNYVSQHSVNYMPEKNNLILSYRPLKRPIIVKESSVGNQDQLRAYAYLLAQYLVKLNQFRYQITLSQVQQVIINDFINLDSFIFKI